MTTARTIIKKAMQKGGILTKYQNPTASEYNDALDALNNMLSSWANDSLMVFARTWESFPLTGATSYTMGAGGDFNTVRPIGIIASYVRIGTTDTPVTVINDEAYFNSIMTKDAPGQPEWLNNDNGYPLVKLRPWPVGGAAYTLFLLTEKQLTAFATLDTVVALPPGWERALIFNLPEEIISDYGQKEVPDSCKKIAVSSKSLIQKAILKNHNLDCSPASANPGNVYSGWNN